MTVIAYRDGILASDTLISAGLDAAGQAVKIKKVHREDGSWIVGAAGSIGALQPLVNWVVNGANLSEPVEYPSGISGSGLLVDSAGACYYTDDESKFVVHLTAPYLAIGCGATAARMAMYLGCSSIEAIEAVMDQDLACGGKAVWITIAGDEDLSLSN